MKVFEKYYKIVAIKNIKKMYRQKIDEYSKIRLK
jgi:hypothetical protein